jgi:tripartite-type tricarboxylate transporter receptor subunit TctC
MKLLQTAFAFAVVFANSSTAFAQTYPSRPIMIVVPFPAGGPTDTLVRVMSERMRTSLGQPLVVEHVAGAGGSIGVARVARALPDGYTLSIGNWNSHVSSQAIYPVEYDLLKDLEPVSRLPVSRLWLVGSAALPAKDAAQLLGWLRSNPDKASAATAGAGSAAHLCGIYFQSKTGTRFQLVHYRGGAPAYQDLMAGHVDLMCAEASATLPHVRSGKIKAYAVLADTRWRLAPDIPTLDEVGVPGLYISFWHGLWVPKGTPKDVIAKLNAAVAEALADPTVSQRVTELGQDIPPPDQQTPEALRAYHKAEIEKWWPIIKAAGVKVD